MKKPTIKRIQLDVHRKQSKNNYEDGEFHTPGHSEYRVTGDRLLQALTHNDTMGRVCDFSLAGIRGSETEIPEGVPAFVTFPSDWKIAFSWVWGYSEVYIRHCKAQTSNAVTYHSLSSYRDRDTYTSYDRGSLESLVRRGVTDRLPSGSTQYGVLDRAVASYDGNRLSSLSVTSDAQVYDARAGIRSTGTLSFSYDDSGRVTRDGISGIRSAEYDNNGMPVTLVTGNGTYTYTHDNLGNRMASAYAGSGGAHTLRQEYTGNGHLLRNDSLVMSRLPGGFFDFDGCPHYYMTDYQGNNIGVFDKDGSLIQGVTYYPSGEPWTEPVYGDGARGNRFLFGGKERETAGALNLYDFTARHYSAAFPRFTSIDPECEKFYHLNPYTYCAGNPVNFIYPTGRYTLAQERGNGIYEIVGGSIEEKDADDYKIYIVDADMNRTGEIIGITATPYSFYNSDKKCKNKNDNWERGNFIDLNDLSGIAFLNNIISDPPTLKTYIYNARNDHEYDFKATNGSSEKDNSLSYYRGMPIGKTPDNISIIASARDIGNMAAGNMAASSGISWTMSRTAFDTYQFFSTGSSREGISTRSAERKGWNNGNAAILSKSFNLFDIVGSFYKEISCK